MLSALAMLASGRWCWPAAAGRAAAAAPNDLDDQPAPEGSARKARLGRRQAAAGFEISAEDRKCLKEKGVELPEFKGGEGPQTRQEGEAEGGEMPEGGEIPAAVLKAAKCRKAGRRPAASAAAKKWKRRSKNAASKCPNSKVGRAAKGGAPNVNSAAFKKQVKEYVACVRENGYELAEPNFSGEGPIFDKAESESAAFKKASERVPESARRAAVGGSKGKPKKAEAT